ncbi:MAG: porin family protein [Cyclobacteriaceae bacterium]
MKNILKIFIFGIVLTMTTNVFAQTYGVRAGLNLSNVLYKLGDVEDSRYNMNPGFHVGATVDIPISGIFSFESGLMFSTKGYKHSFEGLFVNEEGISQNGKIETTMNLYYLEIPLTAKASFDIGGAKIYGLFGPYLGLGLSRKINEKVTMDTDTETHKSKYSWPSEENGGYKRLDYGLVFGAGVEIKAFQIGVNYGLGLANLHYKQEIESPNQVNTSMKNRVLGISLGYRFGL